MLHFVAYWVILANTAFSTDCAALSEERQTVLAYIWKTFWSIQKKKHFSFVCCCLPRIWVKNWKEKKQISPPTLPMTFLSIFMSKYRLRSSGNWVCIPHPGPAFWKLESGEITPLWMGSRELTFLPQAAIPLSSATTCFFSTLHSVSHLHYLSLKNTQPWQVSPLYGRREQRHCNSVAVGSSSYHWLSPSQAFEGFP